MTTVNTLKAKIKALKAKITVHEKELAQHQKVHDGYAPAPAIARLIAKQAFSFGVTFLRRKALRKVTQPGLKRKSTRRFATRKEAEQHGRRFQRKHGHKSFVIAKVAKRANAWINWRTGKTNPVLT